MESKGGQEAVRTWKKQLDFRKLVRPEQSFDLVERPFSAGSRSAWLYFVDGFAKDEVMEKVMEFWMKRTEQDYAALPDADAVAAALIPYIEGEWTDDRKLACDMLFSGALVLLLEGYDAYFIIDARSYPTRSMTEPENERVLRGSRDGFVETLIFNTALLRRRVRSPQMTVELIRVGKNSATDVAICYHNGRADQKLIRLLRKKLSELETDALPMGQQSLSELLFPPKWYNPFPKVRYTERPDGAAACILEGRVLLLVDNAPSAMILPTGFFDFFQETDDYYFPPFTGSYLRILRLMLYTAALFFTPVYYLLLTHPGQLPPWLGFLQPKDPGNIPILFQLLLLDAGIDGIKMASLSTPSGLGNSLSIIGGLLLGDYAVQAGWFCPEVILYMAFVATANFVQPNYEMGYALKFLRVLLLILSALFGWAGFFAGCVILIVMIACNKTVAGKSYLYPLIPFSGRKLLRLLLRLPILRKGAGCAPNSAESRKNNRRQPSSARSRSAASGMETASTAVFSPIRPQLVSMLSPSRIINC